jgi:hypothetical protein
MRPQILILGGGSKAMKDLEEKGALKVHSTAPVYSSYFKWSRIGFFQSNRITEKP